MKATNILALFMLTLLIFKTEAQALTSNKKKDSNTIAVNCAYGMGTFAAGENMGGSAFLANSLSADYMPNEKTGVTYGIETGLLGGESQGNTIYAIPAVFRFGWHPNFAKSKKTEFFLLAKLGWGFGIWGSQLELNAKPNGVVGGVDFGSRCFLTPLVDVYAELGYTYYGIARSNLHPEYPLGYGSGKIYASVGLSVKIGKCQ